MLSKIFPKIHAEGYKFLVIGVIVTLVLYSFSDFFGLIGLTMVFCGQERGFASPANTYCTRSVSMHARTQP